MQPHTTTRAINPPDQSAKARSSNRKVSPKHTPHTPTHPRSHNPNPNNRTKVAPDPGQGNPQQPSNQATNSKSLPYTDTHAPRAQNTQLAEGRVKGDRGARFVSDYTRRANQGHETRALEPTLEVRPLHEVPALAGHVRARTQKRSSGGEGG